MGILFSGADASILKGLKSSICLIQQARFREKSRPISFIFLTFMEENRYNRHLLREFPSNIVHFFNFYGRKSRLILNLKGTGEPPAPPRLIINILLSILHLLWPIIRCAFDLKRCRRYSHELWPIIKYNFNTKRCTQVGKKCLISKMPEILPTIVADN